MNKYFGTDGIREIAQNYPLTPDGLVKLGCIFADVFNARCKNVIIAQDTRLSGKMIQYALSSGLSSCGVHVIDAGIIPTAALAYLTKVMDFEFGIMVTASHNPAMYNGLKIFSKYGSKISIEQQDKIEKMLDNDNLKIEYSPLRQIGKIASALLEDKYKKKIFQSAHGVSLKGLKVVVDCAHGAAYRILPSILSELQATVLPIHTAPDGNNINLNCGFSSAQACRNAVISSSAHIGLILDGDADRLHVIDEKGKIYGGDHILALMAQTLLLKGLLKNNGVVSTVMSNQGLDDFLSAKNLKLYRTDVGDRHVFEKMIQFGCNLGGEQSGHIIFGDMTTGDSILASISVLSDLVSSGKPASELLDIIEEYPQKHINLPIPYGAVDLEETLAVKKAIADAMDILGGEGRVNIRKSGTEPLVRVMIEGLDEKKVEEAINLMGDRIRDYNSEWRAA